MKIKIKKLNPIARTPEYSTRGSACFDIRTTGECKIVGNGVVYSTGLSFEIPDGYAMMIYSRSGHGFNSDIRLSNCVGVIDSDYRGELLIKLCTDNINNKTEIYAGDKIAQGMLIEVWNTEFEESEDLSCTDRGSNGFGSTGK